ncbi:hypothetical protein ACIQM0_01135 [Streptomyces sp. NPDC091387]|uniref:hypothetical protein n=1 Tax=Streptomyces sp. NPDC091387 TaxID=3365998 RepID=UPI003802AB5A
MSRSGSGSSRPSTWSARQAAVPGGGPVNACWAFPEAQPAVPATTVVASATATKVLA